MMNYVSWIKLWSWLTLILAVDRFGGVASAFSIAKSYGRKTRGHSNRLGLGMSTSKESGSTPIVALNVILRIKPEVRNEFLDVILNNQRGTLDKDLEPLALEYTFGEDNDEPNTFHFHEKYIGEEGIVAHNKAPHFLVWEEFASTNPFTSPPEVYKFTIYKE